MPEIIEFVRHGSSTINQSKIKQLMKKLPMMKVEFTEFESPQFPHLVNQLEFLANAVEDFAEGAADELPLTAAASAAFALIYAHRAVDLMPTSMGEVAHADDSSVVRAVLLMHERAFAEYAERIDFKWSEITLSP